MSPGSLSFAKLVMMSSAPAKSAGMPDKKKKISRKAVTGHLLLSHEAKFPESPCYTWRASLGEQQLLSIDVLLRY